MVFNSLGVEIQIEYKIYWASGQPAFFRYMFYRCDIQESN